MTPAEHIRHWLQLNPLTPVEVDCAIAVMLKIIDGKCKMPTEEKRMMRALYGGVKEHPHRLLEPSLHQLIEEAGANPDEAVKLQVYEQRLLAETIISRPVMKAFKARIRQLGLYLEEPDIEPASPGYS